MEKAHIIEEWLKEAKFDYEERKSLDNHWFSVYRHGQADDVHIYVEGSPLLHKDEMATKTNSVVVLSVFVAEFEGSLREAWALVDLADPECFYQMDEVIRHGTVSNVKWKFVRG